MLGGTKIEIANQQENHSQDKYFPRRFKKTLNKYISPFFHFPTQQETLAEHIFCKHFRWVPLELVGNF